MVAELQEGKEVDIARTLEQALAGANNGCEGYLLVATDEECYAHVPSPTTAGEERVRHFREQPENEERLKVLVGSPPSGILLTDHCLENDLWLNSCQSATMSDILRVHEYSHLQFVRRACDTLEVEEGKTAPGTLRSSSRRSYAPSRPRHRHLSRKLWSGNQGCWCGHCCRRCRAQEEMSLGFLRHPSSRPPHRTLGSR